MSVYFKETPLFLKEAIDSVLNQSLIPTEVVLVKDGPLTEELDDLIKEYTIKFPKLFKIVSLKENVGLGKALSFGIEACSNDIIARMDTDDICHTDRFEKQISYMMAHPNIDVVGSWIYEFTEAKEKISGTRKVPELNKQILKFHKKRNALNHMSVVFRKQRVVEVGNYIDMPYFEDYYLWSRMMLKGIKFHNLPEALVFARVGNDMIGRRHGWSYVKKELRFFRKLNKLGFISFFKLLQVVLFRVPLRLLPKKVLSIVYDKGMRSK